MAPTREAEHLTRRIYPRPPIVEAVIDFRFPAEVCGSALLDAVVSELGDHYPGARRDHQVLELQASVREEEVAAEARRSHVLTFLTSRDGLRLVGCGDGRLSVHVLAPYPGWESFIEQAQHVMRAVAPVLGEHRIHQIVVRYIDRLVLPLEDGVGFNDLLTAMPSRPSAMPEQLKAFHFVLQSVDHDGRTAATMVLASAPPDADHPVVLYDLQVSTTSCSCAASEGDWLPIVDALHTRQRDIFEASITDRLRETFQ